MGMKSKFILESDDGTQLAVEEGWEITVDQDAAGPVKGLTVKGHKDAWGSEPHQSPMSWAGTMKVGLTRNESHPEYLNLWFAGKGCTSIGFKETPGGTDLMRWALLWGKDKFLRGAIRAITGKRACPTCGSRQ